MEEAYNAVEVARKTGKICKGANEVTKALEKGKLKAVIYAKDVSPPEIVMHLPILSKEKDVPCVGVPSKQELGAAAGIPVGTTAIGILEEGDAKDIISGLSKE